MRCPRPTRPGWGLLLVGLAVLVGCGGEPPAPATPAPADASTAPPDSLGGDVSVPPAEVAGADAAKLAPPLELLDRKALTALRKLADALAPTQALPWPGYALQQIPIYLIARDKVGDGVRGYLVRPTELPKNAYLVDDPDVGPSVYRYDGGVDFLQPDQLYDNWASLAGGNALVMPYSASSLKNEADWVEQLGEAYFERLRFYEAVWAPVLACGLRKYPRESAEVIVLLLVECEVLSEAWLATDPALMQQRLREFHAIRRRAIGLEPQVGRTNNDHENRDGSGHFATRRLLLAAGYETAQSVHGHYATELRKPITLPIEEFDAFMMDARRRSTGGALLELAMRLGWEVEPTFRAGNSVYDLVEPKLGAVPDRLVDEAKKRYDIKAFEARAAELIGL